MISLLLANFGSPNMACLRGSIPLHEYLNFSSSPVSAYLAKSGVQIDNRFRNKKLLKVKTKILFLGSRICLVKDIANPTFHLSKCRQQFTHLRQESLESIECWDRPIRLSIRSHVVDHIPIRYIILFFLVSAFLRPKFCRTVGRVSMVVQVVTIR